MNSTRLLITAILACIISTAVFAQETNTTRLKSRTSANQDSLRGGLKLIYSARDRNKDWEKDLDIDMERLSATIEASVDRAMRSLDVSLRHLDVQDLDADIDFPEIDIREIDIPEIHIPDIDIPEINIHIPDIDVDHHFDRDHDHTFHHDADKVKEKEKSKEKDKEEKRKGLVKIK